MGAAHSVVVGRMTLSTSVWFISPAAICHILGPTWYMVEWTSLILSLMWSVPGYGTFMRLTGPSRMSYNSVSIFKKE